MPTVDPARADWLKREALFSAATVSGAFTKWGDLALDSTIISALALKADADTESAKQAAFMAGPLAREKIDVIGFRKDLVGQVVTITGDRLGYEAGGLAVFVLGAAEQGGFTTLTVLRRLT